MSDATHKDTSKGWLIFFFICFALVVLAIGLFAAFTYKVNAPEPHPSGEHSGMILPQDGKYVRFATAPYGVSNACL